MSYQLPKNDYERYLRSRVEVFYIANKKFVEFSVYEDYQINIANADEEIKRLRKDLRQSKIRNILQQVNNVVNS